MLEARDILCGLLSICFVGVHPWDWVAHFAVNFLGINLTFPVLANIRRLSQKKLWWLSPKTALWISLSLAFSFSAWKEIEDFLYGASADILYDSFYDFCGIALALAGIVYAAKTRTFRHLYYAGGSFYTTIFTNLPATNMTFFGFLPSSQFCTFSLAIAASFASFSETF